MSASESSDENKKINNQVSTTVKYDLLWQNYPYWSASPNSQQSYNSSFDLSPPSSISTTLSEDELSTVSFMSNELKSIPLTENHSFYRQICSDHSFSEKKIYNQKIHPVRPCYPPSQDFSVSFVNEINKQFSEKGQPDPQIRYAFYNKGFEMATSRQGNSTIRQIGMRKNLMSNIDECGSQENEDSNSGKDEWQNSIPSSPYCSGSSGRDITLLPKLKIRIFDETDGPVKDSFDKSSSSDLEYSRNDDNLECCHLSENLNLFDVTYQNDNFDQFLKCEKCGHHLRFQKQFSNAFA